MKSIKVITLFSLCMVISGTQAQAQTMSASGTQTLDAASAQSLAADLQSTNSNVNTIIGTSIPNLQTGQSNLQAQIDALKLRLDGHDTSLTNLTNKDVSLTNTDVSLQAQINALGAGGGGGGGATPAPTPTPTPTPTPAPTPTPTPKPTDPTAAFSWVNSVWKFSYAGNTGIVGSFNVALNSTTNRMSSISIRETACRDTTRNVVKPKCSQLGSPAPIMLASHNCYYKGGYYAYSSSKGCLYKGKWISLKDAKADGATLNTIKSTTASYSALASISYSVSNTGRVSYSGSWSSIGSGARSSGPFSGVLNKNGSGSLQFLSGSGRPYFNVSMRK